MFGGEKCPWLFEKNAGCSNCFVVSMWLTKCVCFFLKPKVFALFNRLTVKCILKSFKYICCLCFYKNLKFCLIDNYCIWFHLKNLIAAGVQR